MTKRTLTFTLGFIVHATLAAEIARRLKERGGFRCDFKVTFQNNCTVFETAEPVACGIEKFATLKAYIDGIRDAVVLGL